MQMDRTLFENPFLKVLQESLLQPELYRLYSLLGLDLRVSFSYIASRNKNEVKENAVKRL